MKTTKTTKFIFGLLFFTLMLFGSNPAYAVRSNYPDSELNDVQDYIDNNASLIHTLLNFGGAVNVSLEEVEMLSTLFESLKSSRNYRRAINNFFEDSGYGNAKDDLASVFVLIMAQQTPTLADEVMGNDNANNYLYDRIQDGGAVAFGSTVLSWSVVYLAEFGAHTSIDYLNSY